MISQIRALRILEAIVSARSNGELLLTELKLTRKQFYTSMSLLKQSGLVKKQNGRYLLTAFGKVIYSAQINLETKIQNALANYWKLKAIDSLVTFSSPNEESDKIISLLIDDKEIRNILVRKQKEPKIAARPVAINKTLTVRPNAALVIPH